MSPHRLRLAALAGGLLFAACSAVVPGTPLKIETAGFRWELYWTCTGGGLLPVRIHSDGNLLRFTSADGDDVRLIWPNGFVARVVDGQATLFASDGSVVGREGDELTDLGTCESRDGVPIVASVGPKSYR
jgi:hypothetical protein